jgi:hypothetical protein
MKAEPVATNEATNGADESPMNRARAALHAIERILDDEGAHAIVVLSELYAADSYKQTATEEQCNRAAAATALAIAVATVRRVAATPHLAE